MAKILYAGTASDFVVTTVTVPASAGGTVDVLKLNPGASLEAWGAGTAGSQITDIALFDGSYTTPGGVAPSGIFPAESSSTFLFWAEDTFDAIYVTGEGQGVLGGQRWLARPVNDVARLRALEALDPIPDADRGVALGVATLGADGLITPSELPPGAGAVDSVNALTGAVVLTEANTNFTPNTRTISPGTGLTGGGNLTANRTISAVFGTGAGTVAEGNHTHGGFTTSPRPVFAQVIASGAPTEWITAAAADPYTWVCDGTNDEVQINLAIDAAAPKQGASPPFNPGMPATAKHLGMVQLSGGRFNIGSAGVVIRTAVHLNGAGLAGTELRAVSCNQTGLIRLGASNDHLCHVSNMYLNGNSGSGGTCSAIDFDMTSSGNTTPYPDVNGDSYHHIHDLYIDEFRGTNRHGINLWASGTANNRGNIIDRIQIRDCTGGSGIRLSAASDSFISNCHVGGSVYAYNIATGNTKISNCKSFYSTTAGFYMSSGRGNITGCEAQDDEVGFYFDAAPYTAAGLVADSCNQAGIRVSTSELCIAGFSIFNRGGIGSGIEFETSIRGLWYDAGFNDQNLMGNVKAANTTTPISGTTPTNSILDVLTI